MSGSNLFTYKLSLIFFIFLTPVSPVFAANSACVDSLSKQDEATNNFIFRFLKGNTVTILDQHRLTTGKQRQIMAEVVNDVWSKYSNTKLKTEILIATYFVNPAGDRDHRWAAYYPNKRRIVFAMNNYNESFNIDVPDSIKLMFLVAHEAKHLVQHLVQGKELIATDNNHDYINDHNEIDANMEAMDYIKGRFPFTHGSITLGGREYVLPSASSYNSNPYME